MKYGTFLLFLICVYSLCGAVKTLPISFEKLNSNGMCAAWTMNRASSYHPSPKHTITKENGKNVIHFTKINGKNGFAWATLGRFPARSGDKVIISARVKGRGKFTFQIQTLDTAKRWTSSKNGTYVQLTPLWRDVVMNMPIHNVGRTETGYFLIQFTVTKGSELYITDIKAQHYHYDDKAEFRDQFIPTPVECKSKGSFIFSGKRFTFENKGGVSSEALNWLSTGLKRVLGWERLPHGKGSVKIVFAPLKERKSTNREYYELTIAPGRITVRAETKAGYLRGIGRIMGIVESGSVKNIPGRGFAFPLLEMKDQPRIAERGFMLHIPGPGSHFKTMKDWRRHHYRYIDVAAMLGYNVLFINFGGNMELKRHPELVRKSRRIHTQEEIRKMIAYASALGMKVYPMTSAIGHYSGGYQIYPIEQKKAPNINGALITARAMNLGHPDFYRVFFEVMDEILDVFNAPEYIMLRTDEFYTEMKLLERHTKKKTIGYYSEFMNRAARHAAKRNCRIVVCQDMWVPARKIPGEEANGPADAEKLLDMVDKNVSICYWRYDYGPMKWLRKFKEKGFNDLWVMPWYEPEPTRLLIGEGFIHGAKVFAGIWSEPGQNNGLSAIAQYAWDPHAKPFRTHRLDHHSDLMFYARETKIPAPDAVCVYPAGGIAASDHPDVKTLRSLCKNDSGIPVDFSKARKFNGKSIYKKLEKTPDLSALYKNGTVRDYFFGVKGCPQLLNFRNPGQNKSRLARGFMLYTSAYGKTTRTNIYGHEFALKGDTVALTDMRFGDRNGLPRLGNFPIYKDLLTFSRHSLNFHDDRRHGYRNSNMLMGRFVKGTRLDFYKKVQGVPPSGKISWKLSGKRYKAVLYLLVTGHISRFGPLAVVNVKTRNGRKIRDLVDSYRWHISGYNYRKNFHYYLPWQNETHYAQIGPVIAIEYFSDSPLTEMEIVPEKPAADAGLTALGVTEYQTVPAP